MITNDVLKMGQIDPPPPPPPPSSPRPKKPRH